MAVISICRHNQAGFCKFGEKCRNRHIDEICGSDKCDDEDCILRHPMACRFFSLNGICKFGSGCAYLHKESEEKTKIRHLEEQLDATVEKVKELENIVKKFYLIRCKDTKPNQIFFKIPNKNLLIHILINFQFSN